MNFSDSGKAGGVGKTVRRELSVGRPEKAVIGAWSLRLWRREWFEILCASRMMAVPFSGLETKLRKQGPSST